MTPMAQPAVQQPIETGPDQTDAQSRRRRALGGLLLLAAVIIILVWLFLESIAIVPNTIGMSRARSVQLLGNAGFSASVATITASDRLAGRVVAQAPGGGGWYFKFWPVHLDVGASSGLASVGLQLTGYGTASGNYDLPVDFGTAAEQMPFDAEEMSPLFVPGVGSSRWLMPDVLNLPESQALSEIRGAGLTTIAINKGGATTDVHAGHVYFQDPPPGVDLAGGESVTLWVSTGPFNQDGSYGGGTGIFPRP